MTGNAYVFGQVLPDQPVGILHGCFLPGTTGFGKEDTFREVLGDLVMVGHLAPLVPRERATECRGDGCRDRCRCSYHRVCPVPLRETDEMHVAATAFGPG